MKFSLKLAALGIKKNKKLYIPYYLMGGIMIMASVIFIMLGYNEKLLDLHGGHYVRDISKLGFVILVFFCAIFFFYTHSFLIRRREKELGLYQILGLSYRKISMIIFMETLISYIITFIAGLVSGMIFYKIAEIVLFKLSGFEATSDYSFSIEAVLLVIAVFGIIHFLIFIRSLFSIGKSAPIELLKSENKGEKPPKSNIILAIAGMVLLIAGYFMAVSVSDPVLAIKEFFIAVIIVIAATYLIMISSSVFIFSKLKKNKNYYYKKSNFVAISQLLYRIKRNGAGLASICILSTMALVTVSSVSSLYFGREDMSNKRFPREFIIDGYDREKLKSDILKVAEEYGKTPDNFFFFSGKDFTGDYAEGKFTAMKGMYGGDTSLNFIPYTDYKTLSKSNFTLETGECFVYSEEIKNTGDFKFKYQDFDEMNFKITRILDSLPHEMLYQENITPIMWVIVSDEDYTKIKCDYNNTLISGGFDLEGSLDFKTDFSEKLHQYMNASSKAEMKAVFYSIYGGLFFLGIFVSILFLLITVLIIYYKQLSESYEDRDKYLIMEKIGMTDEDIKESIKKQMNIMFFMPLGFAIIHSAFAYPMISLMLSLFGLMNDKIFLITTAVSILIFSIIYFKVCRKTSKVYYEVVSV